MWQQTFIFAWLLLPAVAANMAPVVFGNSLGFIGKPISVRWFGDHKTWRGIITATFTGGLVYLFQLWAQSQFEVIPSETYTRPIPFYFGFLVGFVAIMGDLVKSGLKRWRQIEPGAGWFPFDQLDFMVPSMLLAQVYLPFWPASIAILLGFTLVLHPTVNRLAYITKLKDRPW